MIKTLVLDNEATYSDLIAEILEEDGQEVYCVKSLAEAREQLGNHQFHLAVIDIVLDNGEDGLELLDDISKINRDTGSFCAPIVFTGNATKERTIQAIRQGVVEFREKPPSPEDLIVSKMGKETKGFAEQEFLGVVRNVLGKVLVERSRKYKRQKHTIFFQLTPNKKTSVELIGPTSFVSESSRPLEIDINDYSDRTDDLQFHFSQRDEEKKLKWRVRAKSIGTNLHNQIFEGDAELVSCLFAARERSGKNPLHVIFRGSQEILRIPMELLPGETGHLITEYPISRQISGIKTVRTVGIDSIFEEEVDTIKILLIGSNTYPPIPGADEEITQLEYTLRTLLQSRGLKSKIQVVPSQDASYGNVYDHLEHCQYHIVHYAGHGFHDESDTDESGIFFWEGPNRSGNVKTMPIRILRNLLRKSDVRFFFLSCCVGAKTAGSQTVNLKGGDFQGILEGLVRVGIPGVLGYRWNVWDTDAQQFALAFYASLFTDLSLELATFNARRKLQETNYHSETWASPVLVVQTT